MAIFDEPAETWESILRERGSFVAHEAARRFLSEFGGLVTYGWPADSITTSSAIRFDPLAAQWQDERFARASREAGASLYPIGMADEGASFLASPRTEPSTSTDAGPRRPPETDRVLRAGGWFPGRAVPTETWESVLLHTGEFEIHDAARRFLAEFGAVGVPYRAPWDSMPWMQFSLDPLLAIWDGEIIDDLAEQAGVELYPVGMRDRGNQHLAMAEDGAVYAGMDSVWLLAATPDEALQRLTSRIQPTASC
ncbi:SUKH-3 domain-containing protein [Streptomyces violarus]|uniref:SUKH-3 domain-containing protein n=1 Tax=Streptomyces violarus TaxID=67380 RepID=UPI0021BE8367|nr:SUKH-3 domain-containing protein [Streptomyces violarus]MCT9142058.1 SUKH-3 domain-containing protein [Streptomyces violarus]